MGKKDTKYVTYNNSKAQRTLHIFSITSMWWYSHRYDRAHSRPMCRWQRAEYEQCDSVKSQSHTFGRNYQLSAITLKICSSVVASNGSFRTFSFLLSLLIVEIFFFCFSGLVIAIDVISLTIITHDQMWMERTTTNDMSRNDIEAIVKYFFKHYNNSNTLAPMMKTIRLKCMPNKFMSRLYGFNVFRPWHAQAYGSMRECFIIIQCIYIVCPLKSHFKVIFQPILPQQCNSSKPVFKLHTL